MQNKYFKSLGNIRMQDVQTFGGKVASLGEMIGAGIPVPGGFGVSVELQRSFKNIPFDNDAKRQLDGYVKQEKLKRVAVRSSAIAEDSSEASWAGQLESYLNVEPQDIEAAIRDCWDSITSKQAVEYAKDKKITKNDLSVGVLVQAMVDSETSGVMFTKDPVTNKDKILIEGVFGLGEMLVQGIVTPDRWVVNKENGKVEEFDIQIKTKSMVYQKGKNVTRDLSVEEGDKASLNELQVIELAKLGKQIEEYYKKPMDIEWGYCNNRFYILQARPVTT